MNGAGYGAGGVSLSSARPSLVAAGVEALAQLLRSAPIAADVRVRPALYGAARASL